jgi:hypothetical protein
MVARTGEADESQPNNFVMHVDLFQHEGLEAINAIALRMRRTAMCMRERAPSTEALNKVRPNNDKTMP